MYVLHMMWSIQYTYASAPFQIFKKKHEIEKPLIHTCSTHCTMTSLKCFKIQQNFLVKTATAYVLTGL